MLQRLEYWDAGFDIACRTLGVGLHVQDEFDQHYDSINSQLLIKTESVLTICFLLFGFQMA